MEAHPAFTRGDDAFVPPERVMTRLMRRSPSRGGGAWLDYLILCIFIAGIVAGLVLAARG